MLLRNKPFRLSIRKHTTNQTTNQKAPMDKRVESIARYAVDTGLPRAINEINEYCYGREEGLSINELSCGCQQVTCGPFAFGVVGCKTGDNILFSKPLCFN